MVLSWAWLVPAFGLLTSCAVWSPPELGFSLSALNREGLVSASRLKESLIDPRNHLAILHVSWGELSKAEAYLNGHLPGAIHFNTDLLEDGYPTWRLRNVAALQEAFGDVGITPETTVVVYGEQLIGVARVWWCLKYAGVADVRLLDGGMKSWMASGYPLETEIPQPAKVRFVGTAVPTMLATNEEVRARLDGEALLADVRSKKEFEGAASGYDYLEAKGRLPGAIWVDDGESAVYQRSDGRLRDPADILRMWERQELVSTRDPDMLDRELIFYCGGGWRSSLAYFYAWQLGFENIRNYSDGWGGWSTRYLPDSSAQGTTPGWRQVPTGHPVAVSR